jgi:DNA-directed RNA polymerase subunit RPC12/RpoP
MNKEPNMIKFHCLKCQQKIGVKDTAAGGRLKCPQCGAILTIPSPAPESPAATSTPQPSRLPFWVWGSIGFVGVFLIGILIWTFAFRDTWERDHAERIKTLAETASQFVYTNKWKEGFDAYDKLFKLVGPHPLSQGYLKDIVEQARQTYEETGKKYEDQFFENINTLKTTILQQQQARQFKDCLASCEQMLKLVPAKPLARNEDYTKIMAETQGQIQEFRCLAKIKDCISQASADIANRKTDEAMGQYREAIAFGKAANSQTPQVKQWLEYTQKELDRLEKENPNLLMPTTIASFNSTILSKLWGAQESPDQILIKTPAKHNHFACVLFPEMQDISVIRKTFMLPNGSGGHTGYITDINYFKVDTASLGMSQEGKLNSGNERNAFHFIAVFRRIPIEVGGKRYSDPKEDIMVDLFLDSKVSATPQEIIRHLEAKKPVYVQWSFGINGRCVNTTTQEGSRIYCGQVYSVNLVDDNFPLAKQHLADINKVRENAIPEDLKLTDEKQLQEATLQKKQETDALVQKVQEEQKAFSTPGQVADMFCQLLLNKGVIRTAAFQYYALPSSVQIISEAQANRENEVAVYYTVEYVTQSGLVREGPMTIGVKRSVDPRNLNMMNKWYPVVVCIGGEEIPASVFLKE